MRSKPSKSLQVVSGCVLLAAAVLFGGHRATAVEAPPQFETRCGWFSNPTPANIWLYDRDGEWTIGVQGGYQVEGEWPWPQFKRGSGCGRTTTTATAASACNSVLTGRATRCWR